MTSHLPQLRLSRGRAIILFFVIALAGLMIASLSSAFILNDGMTTRSLRVLAIVQDVMVFITPAVATAMLVTNRPADLLGVSRSPGLLATLTAILVLLTATPAMNALVSWNESITLPESFSDLEQAMRGAEEAAAQSVDMLMGGNTVADLIMGVLIIGVMAGLSEEFFFRGGLMRLMSASGLNVHASVWITAVVFSTFHFQFYGFVPRVVLGAFFGYLLVWSGSVWLPAIVHTVNNSIIVVATWLSRNGYIDFDIDTAGSSNFTLILGSIILTAGIIRAMNKHLFPRPAKEPGNSAG